MQNCRSRPRYPVFIKIIGLIGPKTERAVINVEESLNGYRNLCRMEWISDPIAICKLGPIQTPSVYINGEVRAAGRIPSVHEVQTWIKEALQDMVEA